MGTYVDPFNLKKIFLQYFLGNAILWIYVLVIGISYACAYFQMSTRNYAILLTLASLMFAAYLEQAIQFFIIFLVGFICYKILFSR